MILTLLDLPYKKKEGVVVELHSRVFMCNLGYRKCCCEMYITIIETIIESIILTINYPDFDYN